MQSPEAAARDNAVWNRHRQERDLNQLRIAPANPSPHSRPPSRTLLELLAVDCEQLARDVRNIDDPAEAAQKMSDGLGRMRPLALDLVVRMNKERDAQAGVNRSLTLTAL